jgi:hypothetical protein
LGDEGLLGDERPLGSAAVPQSASGENTPSASSAEEPPVGPRTTTRQVGGVVDTVSPGQHQDGYEVEAEVAPPASGYGDGQGQGYRTPPKYGSAHHTTRSRGSGHRTTTPRGSGDNTTGSQGSAEAMGTRNSSEARSFISSEHGGPRGKFGKYENRSSLVSRRSGRDSGEQREGGDSGEQRGGGGSGEQREGGERKTQRQLIAEFNASVLRALQSEVSESVRQFDEEMGGSGMHVAVVFWVIFF